MFNDTGRQKGSQAIPFFSNKATTDIAHHGMAYLGLLNAVFELTDASIGYALMLTVGLEWV